MKTLELFFNNGEIKEILLEDLRSIVPATDKKTLFVLY